LILKVLLVRIAVLHRYGPLFQMEQRGLTVCRSIFLYVMIISPAKTAELIEMLFGMQTQVGPRICTTWAPDPHTGQFSEGSGRPRTCLGLSGSQDSQNYWAEAAPVWMPIIWVYLISCTLLQHGEWLYSWTVHVWQWC